MSDPWAALDALEVHLWHRLARAAADADDPWRIAALGTNGVDGPELRSLALRAADATARTVELHSDIRTAKVEALRRDPRAALLLWDDATQEQLRLSLRITLIPADPDRWDRIPETARVNYGTDPAPGTSLPDPAAVARTPRRERHVALLGQVRGMDALSLAHDPHRRARFGERPGWISP
jgi:hypothetical protein